MRLVVAGLAIFGLISLFSSGVGAGVGLGALLLAPLFIIMKIMFFMFLFGVFAKGIAGRGHHHRHRAGNRSSERSDEWADEWSDWKARWERSTGPRRGRDRDRRSGSRPQQAETDRFEEWHRMAHAKEEVDSWVDPQIDE